MRIMLNFAKKLLVCCIIEFLEGLEVWLAKFTFLVAPQERVDSLLVALVDQSRPSTTRIRHLGDSNRPQNGMKSTSCHSSHEREESSERIASLHTT